MKESVSGRIIKVFIAHIFICGSLWLLFPSENLAKATLVITLLIVATSIFALLIEDIRKRRW